MKRGYRTQSILKSRLLLAAFIVTLVLDMGGGPVFIVYAALNLNKNASFPAATWLLVTIFVSFNVGSWHFQLYTVFDGHGSLLSSQSH